MKSIITLAIVIGLLLIIRCVYADDIETSFKKICLEINKEQVRQLDLNTADKDTEQWQKLAIVWKGKLNKLIESDPNSVWADDAQYLVARLSNKNMDIWIKEFENLLTKYPDCSLEQWTKDAVPLLTPEQVPACIDMRVELISSYVSAGNNEKAQKLYEESIKKYPGVGKYFKVMYNLTDTSIQSLMKLSDEELGMLEKSVGVADKYNADRETKARQNTQQR